MACFESSRAPLLKSWKQKTCYFCSTKVHVSNPFKAPLLKSWKPKNLVIFVVHSHVSSDPLVCTSFGILKPRKRVIFVVLPHLFWILRVAPLLKSWKPENSCHFPSTGTGLAATPTGLSVKEFCTGSSWFGSDVDRSALQGHVAIRSSYRFLCNILSENIIYNHQRISRKG